MLQTPCGRIPERAEAALEAEAADVVRRVEGAQFPNPRDDSSFYIHVKCKYNTSDRRGVTHFISPACATSLLKHPPIYILSRAILTYFLFSRTHVRT